MSRDWIHFLKLELTWIGKENHPRLGEVYC